ncbi:hypothetical protein PAHAL_5G516100 [Panicum hallii]|uniref:Uncharacterized protein n=1 Tax=Panicum hallii TaxID=206008 RepID=A0A2S3HYT9_9POAL|nr:hypothetical protein PAHAL_5G516100 [Panicum hallii]
MSTAGTSARARQISSQSTAAAAPLTTPCRRRPITRAPTSANFSPRSPPWPRPEGYGALSRSGGSVRDVCVGEETAPARWWSPGWMAMGKRRSPATGIFTKYPWFGSRSK